MTATANAALSTYAIGDRHRRLPRVPQCRVCSSEFRPQVETALARGESYQTIVDRLPDCALSSRNVREHLRRGHLPVEDEVFRRIQEDQATEVGDLIQSAVDRKMGELALAHAVVGRVTERLAVGEVQPTMREGIAAAKLLAQYDAIRLERDDLRRERDDAQRALFGILSLAKRLLAVESWSLLGRQVDEDEALRAFWPPPTG